MDTAAPAVTLTQKPTDPSSNSSPSFEFTSNEPGTTFACKLDAAAFAPCASPKSYAGLVDGSHTFTVKATDAAGNTGPETTYTWATDTIAPTATIDAKPTDPSNSNFASFGFTASESGSHFACRLNEGAFATCTSPISYSSLGDGSYTFGVRATDAAGNTGPETSYTWTIDTIAPTATITQKPGDPSNVSSPSFTFTPSQPGSTFLCRLDAEAFAPCSSPKSYTDLADGSHTFAVKATDPAGNTGPETSHTWTVDTIAPTASISAQPNNPSNNPSPSLAFTASQAGSTFACKLDAAAFAPCTSPKGYTDLADGIHTFTVKATDAAGNTGLETSYTWTIDTIAPTATITEKPGGLSNAAAPSFSFTASQSGSTFDCKLDAGAFGSCASPKSYTDLADGPHTFTVKATDPAGNAGPETVYTWTIDATAPTATITQKPNAASSVESPSFSFTAGEPSTFACKLDEGAFGACTSPKSYSDLADGAHEFSVKATDAAGNTGVETSHVWTIDTVAPIAGITGKPANPSNDTSPSFAFGANEAVQLECKLDAGVFAPCTSPKTFTGVPAGAHTFTVKATDPAGNPSAETSYGWTIDVVAPTTTFSLKPADPSNSASPSFSFTANETVSHFSCKLDAEAFAPCSSPKSYAGLAEGSHTFVVRATDEAANTGADASHTWTIDITPPTTSITEKPADPSNSASPSFTFSASQAGSTFACKLDAGAFAPCVSAKTYAGLAEGTHTFAVKATDAAGNVSTETSHSWTIDTIAPTASITAPLIDPSNNASPSFTFTASQIGSTFVCKLDLGAFAPCSSPKSFAGLADGSHMFIVEATDPAGNTSAPTSFTWTIDTVAPTASITGKPSDPSNSTGPSFAFTANQAGSTFVCKLDAGAFAPCASPKSYSDLAEGAHTLTVKATDPAGNPSAETSYTWTIDTAAPTATITDKPVDPSNIAGPSFTFTASQPGSTFECKLNAAAFAPCTSPKSYAGLANGSHTFIVKAIDPALNSSAETSYSWTIDTIAPTTAITTKPNSPSGNGSPSFQFASSEGGSTLACKLDAGAFGPCTSPKTYPGLTDGSHTFTVKSTDTAGNTGAETSYTWTIDTTAPTTAITGKPSNLTNANSAIFDFSASESSTYTCHLDGASFSACTSPKTYAGLTDGSHSFTVKSTDTAGNTGPETTYSWTIDTAPPTVGITEKPNTSSNETSPSFSFSAEAGSSIVCKLDAQAFAACASPKSYISLAEGSHTFTVKATDPAGNAAQVPYTWTIDTTPPIATIAQKPNHPSGNSSASFTFTSSEPNSSFACRIEQAGFGSCGSPKSYTDLPDGDHTFAVKATDAAGNTGSAAVFDWKIDTVAPTTAITAKPALTSNNRAPSFSFTADEPGTSIQCRLDGAAFAACSSPIGYSGLADGPHTFAAKATDQAGNTGPQTVYTWTIETRAPTATLDSTPAALSNSSTATFSFSADEPSTYECKLDGRSFEACSSPETYLGLGDGPHTFSVRAQDTVGNPSIPVSHEWTIDTVAPATTITAKPANPSNNRAPSFSFTAGEAGSSMQCSLDGAAFAACVSPIGYSGMADGAHTFAAKATDPAGNTGPQTVYSWTIETRAPTAALTSTPATLGNSSVATFSFTADEPSSFDCKLDDGAFAACSSPTTYNGLGDGAHTFSVRAQDSVGNFSAPVSHGWTIDTTAPETTLGSKPASKTTGTSASFSFTSNEGGTFECRLDGLPFARCPSPKSYAGLSKGEHQFEVRAIDGAGNVDASPAAHNWAIEAAVSRTTSALLAPSSGARVTKPPLLVWKRNARARYYNVQLFRGGAKIFTAWPTRTRLQLRGRWKFNGRVRQLKPGTYRWYVWPGYGAPAARRYGAVLGQSSFVFARRSGR